MIIAVHFSLISVLDILDLSIYLLSASWWLKSHTFIFGQLLRLEVRIKVFAGLFSSEAFFLGLQIATFSLCLPINTPMCAHVIGVFPNCLL